MLLKPPLGLRGGEQTPTALTRTISTSDLYPDPAVVARTPLFHLIECLHPNLLMKFSERRTHGQSALEIHLVCSTACGAKLAHPEIPPSGAPVWDRPAGSGDTEVPCNLNPPLASGPKRFGQSH